MNVGLVSDGKVVILDAIIGNKSVFDENYLEITDKGTFITNASLFKNYDYSGIKSIKNEGVLRFSGGYLRAIDVISNTGDDTIFDVSKGVVEVSGKVFLEKTKYEFSNVDENGIVYSEYKNNCPTIYQYVDISKKGNLTTSADSLKGNVVSYGTLKLTDGTLQIQQTQDRAFAIQNMGKLTINEDVNILSDIDNFSTITMTNAVIGYKDPDASIFGKLFVSDNLGLIENYRTLTLKSYVDKTLYVQNINGLAIRNEYNSYTGKKVPLLTIKDKVIFRNNTNSSGNGGAILNISNNNSRKPKVVLDGTSTGYYDESILDTSFLSEFRNNSAINGGAISNEGGTVSANSFVFVYNTASGYGGSIYNLEGTYSAKDTYYYHNSADNGGAIYNADVAKINYSSFFKNEAKNGGAIYNDGSLTITNSIVGGSKFIPIYHIMNVGATKYYYHPYGYSVELPNNAEIGAGLYNTGIATITSSSFYNNIATNLGGAIYNQGKLTVTSSDFHNNIAQEGGAIYSNSNEKVVISKSDFEDNSADNGGAVYFNSGISEVKNSIFGVTGTSVLYKYGEEIKREEQSDGNNSINGGAIYNNENSSTTITSCEFLKNSASLTEGKGGDIYNSGTMTINKSYFGGFIPKRRDGRLLIYAVVTKVDDYKYVVSNEQLSNGWEVNTEYSSSYYPINPIKPIEPVKEITPYDIWGASALQGGAIYNTGTLTINSSYIMNAFAKEGGGLYNESNNLVKITSSTFKNNLATDVSEQGLVAKGGAIYNNGNNLQITKSKFNENKSDNFGGAIYNANTGNLTVTSSTFTGNYAVNDEKSGCGGAIYADGVTTITSSTFKNNEADFGGAIYIAQNAEVVVQDSSFTNNIANEAGGAIYVDENASLTINAVKKDVTFSGNMANGVSNSIYLAENSFLTLHTEKKRKITIKDNIEVADGTASISITGAGKTYIVNKDALNDIIVKPEQNSTMSLANSNVETTTFKGLNLEGTS
ncbi:hypothetical protein IKJ53_03170, partial [bacterium]|nr:hypothetical protein [bacterium]